ncbi:helix-turn-helix domain containing protein [Streptomyces europaeiscabiei]|uniref:Helix-turn-helix domain containing protein n=1 Tax=Streptomyces europaeiscabiei TaxID=146819 RepID=A0AAJ2PZZ1_9ACTN|nr:TetR/AcrR family transcriptional regulator [Streptomyces europaeiscabiei]MDX2522837.1 helix-turn-helix domain containing protein [Streptomyces europaeiscabiei]MDX2763190.1 helix-turn-helix domain containing protein [Streptomyces europaeiscabiei]MDX2772955.1 helix-turn-helix domain containing protein [Streptomyces europaeiscabiei]MDX3136672.1 helix-turn-helix domain containing protein [Streptomyces europaeiscabiei]MDX3547080.1 helix-turn-helix domain containing protein [Streptomyces europaei
METATATAVRRKVPRPRADALRNRERIVSAAREMFVEFGPEVPLDEVARRAGVGNATLYRNFPDRDALVREVVCSVMDRTALAAEAALTETGDAFEALSRFVHTSADERISALCPMIQSAFDKHHPDLEAARERLEEQVEGIMKRARDAGQLRSDVGVGDLMIAVSQLSRPPAGTQCAGADRFLHRHLQLFLDGLRAPALSELPGAPITVEDLRRPCPS